MNIRKNDFLSRLLSTTCYIDGDGDDTGGGSSDTGEADTGDTGDDDTDEGGGTDDEPVKAAKKPEAKAEPDTPKPYSGPKDPKNPTKEWVDSIRAKGGKVQLPSEEVRALANYNPKNEKTTPEEEDPKAKKGKKDTPKLDKDGKPVPDPKAKKPDAKAKAEPAPFADLTQAIKDGFKQVQTPAPKDDTKKTDAPTPWYGGTTPALDIPDQVLEAINSDVPETQKKGMNYLINQVGNIVVRDVINQILPAMHAQIMGQIPQVLTQHQARQESHTAFYSKYENLKDPALAPALDAIGIQLAQQWQRDGKSPVDSRNRLLPEFMDAMAQEFYRRAGMQVPEQNPENGDGQTQDGVLNRTPAGKSPFIAKRQARPPADDVARSKSAEFSDVLGVR